MNNLTTLTVVLTASSLLFAPALPANAAAAHKPIAKATSARKAVTASAKPKRYTVDTVPLPTAARPLIVQWLNTRGEMVSDIYFDGYGCGEPDSTTASITSSVTGEEVGSISLCYGKIMTYDTIVPLAEFKSGINSNSYISSISLNKINETQIFRIDDYDQRNAFHIGILDRIQTIRDSQWEAQKRKEAAVQTKAVKPSQKATGAPTARDILQVSDLLNEELRGKERTDTPGALIIRSTLGDEIGREYRSVDNVSCTKLLPAKFRCSYTMSTHPVATDENSLFGIAYSLTNSDSSYDFTFDFVFDGGNWISPALRASIEDDVRESRAARDVAKEKEQRDKWDEDQRKFNSCLRDANTC